MSVPNGDNGQVNEYPTREDLTTLIDPPFAIDSTGSWYAIGLGPEGLILEFQDAPDVYRYYAQVVVEHPDLEPVSNSVLKRLLRERGINPLSRLV